MVSDLTKYVAWNRPGLTSRCRGIGGTGQDGSGRGNASEKSRLHLVLSFSLQEGQGQNGLMKSYGERAQPLQSVDLST